LDELTLWLTPVTESGNVPLTVAWTCDTVNWALSS